MKKIFTLFFALSAFTGIQAQHIDSMVVSPANPTTADPLSIYIYHFFPNSNCEGTAQWSQNGNMIYGNALHCQGMLSAICYDTDTITLPPQPVGTYIVIFTLDAGFGGPPCSPPFVSNDTDTLIFTVGPTSVPEIANAQFSLSPNPSDGNLQLKGVTPGSDTRLRIFANDGRLLREYAVRNENETFDTALPPGLYLAELSSDGQRAGTRKLLITH